MFRRLNGALPQRVAVVVDGSGELRRRRAGRACRPGTIRRALRPGADRDLGVSISSLMRAAPESRQPRRRQPQRRRTSRRSPPSRTRRSTGTARRCRQGRRGGAHRFDHLPAHGGLGVLPHRLLLSVTGLRPFYRICGLCHERALVHTPRLTFEIMPFFRMRPRYCDALSDEIEKCSATCAVVTSPLRIT